MRTRSRCAWVLSIALAASCSAARIGDDAAARLATADRLDRETRALILAVLNDVKRGEHRFDADARRQALEAVRRLDAVEFTPRLRDIATMTFATPDGGDYSDLVAVSGALDVLTDLKDPAAATASVQHLPHAWLRGFAVRNLARLHAWDATPAVEETLLNTELSNGNGHEVVAALTFLQQSPQTTASLCQALQRVSTAYDHCIRNDSPAKPSFCASLSMLTIELSNARCGTSRNP